MREKELVYNIKEQVYLEKKKKSNFDKFYIISFFFLRKKYNKLMKRNLTISYKKKELKVTHLNWDCVVSLKNNGTS